MIYKIEEIKNQILCGDALKTLKELPAESIDCCITSPPYYGLRDYETDGQIGLEKTWQEYIGKLIKVFNEVKRILKKEGTLFLNLGDSYAGSGKGRNADGTPGKTESLNKNNRGSMSGVILPSNAGSEESYDTSDKEVEDYSKNDCLCENLCGECRRAYQIGKFYSENSLVPKQVFLPSLPNHEHKESASDHFPTSDFSLRDYHNTTAKQDSASSLIHEDEQVLSSQESNFSSSSCELKENVSNQNHEAKCLLCGCSFLSDVQVSEHKKVCNCGIEMPSDALNQSRLDNVSLGLAYPNYSRSFLKSKDLVGIPWRVAFALQQDGWYLRQDIIWAKPNPMPESVTDRCTKSHEYIFLLAKSPKYYFDNEAIKEPHKTQENRPDGIVREREFGYNTDYPKVRGFKMGNPPNTQPQPPQHHGQDINYSPIGRNKRSVWTITTKPNPIRGVHFATFPEDLIEPMILAGTSDKGVCPDCGKAWKRIVEKKWTKQEQSPGMKAQDIEGSPMYRGGHHNDGLPHKGTTKTLSWQPTCKCDKKPIPAIILDPFIGSGTSAIVAKKLGRNYLGIDLSEKYCEMAKERISGQSKPLF